MIRCQDPRLGGRPKTEFWDFGYRANVRTDGSATGCRAIYIHGCPDAIELGFPASHGCIRMTNADVIGLFDRVEVGARVEINE